METDIFNHTKQVEILRTIGETKGLNYLLVGKPNTGKTTFIKALASKHNMDVYVVNGETLKVGTIKQILNPGQKLEKKVLLVVRNFDAFFKDCKHFISPNLLTEINKSLDGKYDSGNTIRIFTSDQSKYNYLPDSITDRFYGIFQFNYPDSEMLREKLIRLIDVLPEEYQCYTENKMEKIDEFISLFSMRENVSLKEFTNYCIKYLFEKNNLDKMIEKFEK
jgi:AAA+ superfamily predicted ATPase